MEMHCFSSFRDCDPQNSADIWIMWMAS
jgi:hypothetical protein